MNTIVKTIGQAALLSCLLFSVLKAHAAVVRCTTQLALTS